MTLTLRYAVRSDRGLVRGNNEDSVYAGPRLLAVADGMGGHAAGEVASKIVIGSIERLDEDRPPGDLLAALRSAVLEANQGIADAIDRDEQLEGMGTTLTALRFSGRQVGLAHVGDSRAYLLRGELLAQITHDDTYVQSLVDAGRLTAEEASHHPRKSVILRALMGGEVEPDVSIREARAGDRYLLCSDGLSDVVSAETIGATLRQGDPQEAADRLVELALKSGGPDNVTVIVADVVEADYGDDVPVIGGAFVDPTAPSDAGNDSPAERAARMTRHPAQSPQHAPRRRWLRPVITTLIVLAVVIGGIAGFYAWTQTQYFVGRDGNEVAIFRGVNTAFGPIKFYDVAENSDIRMDDLTQAAQNQVESGITAQSLDGARRVISNLRGQRLPVCPDASAAPGSSAPSEPRTSATPPRTSGQHRAAPTHPATGSRTRTGSSARRSASRTPTTTPPPAPTRVWTPGVNCRSS